MVTKIRGVGVPSTSSTKYVPGTSCSPGVPSSARGGVGRGHGHGRGRLVGWAHGVVVAGRHERDRDHGGGGQQPGDQDPLRPLAVFVGLARSLEIDHGRFLLGELNR